MEIEREIIILGEILNNKKIIGKSLQQIYGIGEHKAKRVCEIIDIDYQSKTINLSVEKENAISNLLENSEEEFLVEDKARIVIRDNINLKKAIQSHEGRRLQKGFPLKGRTRSNARTAKRLMNDPFYAWKRRHGQHSAEMSNSKKANQAKLKDRKR